MVEVTLEANPGTFEQEKFTDFRQLGINRLSIGVQSFNDKHLQSLGRIHAGDEARRAINIAHSAGFDNVNVDLMFALPEQSESEALNDVRTAIALEPTHISYYELTLEPNTLFAKHPPKLPLDEMRWRIQDNGMQLLAEHGYTRYEISAFAKPGRQSEHNVNYWLFGDYLGVGAGAHSKVTFASNGEIVRRWKHKHPTRYMQGRQSPADGFIGGETVIAQTDSALEFMMNALRLRDGFTIPVFEQHTGMSLHHWQSAVNTAIEKGLMEQVGFTLKATPQGFDFLNDLLELFMPLDKPSRNYPFIPLKLE